MTKERSIYFAQKHSFHCFWFLEIQYQQKELSGGNKTRKNLLKSILIRVVVRTKMFEQIK